MLRQGGGGGSVLCDTGALAVPSYRAVRARSRRTLQHCYSTQFLCRDQSHAVQRWNPAANVDTFLVVVQVLLVAFTVLVMIFAARKFTQPVKDDIGDKSVFEFQKLPKDEQEAKLAVMRQSRDPLADD